MYSILDFEKEVNLIKMRVFSWHVNIEQSNLSCNGNFNYENVYTCMFCLTAVNLIEEQVIYYYNSSYLNIFVVTNYFCSNKRVTSNVGIWIMRSYGVYMIIYLCVFCSLRILHIRCLVSISKGKLQLPISVSF